MRSLTVLSKSFLHVAAGVSRLTILSQTAKSEPTHLATLPQECRRLARGSRHQKLAGGPPALLLILTLLCGCRTPQSLFTASGPCWNIRQGQALWRPERGLPEFGGDLVLASNPDGRCLLQFDKTPMSIVFAQMTTNRWLIRFPQRNMGFSGHEPPSTRFAWLYLPTALAGKPLPKSFRFEDKSDGSWRLENIHTGEIVEGYLSP